ncbi:MAG: transcription elongation factor GreA [Lachnospiraceae bacterium]|nr:transcription elongation factor GreA [Lachnospiraceae bacterium]
MAEKRNILTASGAAKLQEELRELKEVRRAEIAQKIKEARAQGDLSENAEYDAAKEEQGEIEARINELQDILKHADVITDEVDLSRVFIGSIVTVHDIEFDEDLDMMIVGSTEANSLQNRISNESPLGQALIGAKVGDTVEVSAPAGTFSYQILKIQKAS